MNYVLTFPRPGSDARPQGLGPRLGRPAESDHAPQQGGHRRVTGRGCVRARPLPRRYTITHQQPHVPAIQFNLPISNTGTRVPIPGIIIPHLTRRRLLQIENTHTHTRT